VRSLRTAFALSLFLSLFLVAGCSKEQPLPQQPVIEDDSTPVDGGTVIRRLQADINTLNPLLIASKYDHYIAAYLFTPLLQLDANLLPTTAGSLTDKYEVSPDGKLYTFHLNPKATFSDGTPVHASDAVFSLKKIVDPKSESAEFAGWFEKLDAAGTKAVDDHTLVVAFTEARAPQLVSFNGVRVIPEHVYAKGDFKSAFGMSAVGSGPYRLVRRIPGKEILLERRSDYWGVPPHIQNVLFKIIGDDNTAWNALKRGDIDETIIGSDTWLNESRRPELQKTINFRRFYTLNYNYIGWSEHDPLLADKRVRRALAMCVDMQSVIDGLYHGTARAMNGPFTPDQWSYNPEVPVIQFNPEGARQILNSMGWQDTDGDGILDKDHKPFAVEIIIAGGSPTSVAFTQLYQAELKKVGIDLKISPLDGGAFIQRLVSGNFQAAYASWDLDPDPDPNAIYHSSQFPPGGQNFVFYKNPAADALIDQGRHELDHTKRVAIYRQLHALLADDQPYTWTVQVSLKWALTKRIKNAKESKGWGFFFWYPGELDWWIPKSQQGK